VRHREAQLPAGAAHQDTQGQAAGLRPAAAGEAEGQAHLRRAREPVPADRQRGITGETLLQLLERRLDNAVYRLGFASSRAQARQLVRHGHFLVNGKKVDIPSYQVRAGDAVSVREGSHKNPAILHAMEEVKGRGVPDWLSLDAAGVAGKVLALPTREQINLPVQEQLIVELYSK
jgi:small subunit ribosomal protein S4